MAPASLPAQDSLITSRQMTKNRRSFVSSTSRRVGEHISGRMTQTHASSGSTSSARNRERTNGDMRTLEQQGSDSPSSVGASEASSPWRSRVSELFSDPEFRLEWDNDLAFHVARHLQELRAYRGFTQAEVAERAGVSQPKIAGAEGGNANLTLRSVVRFAHALNGRIRFALEPSERSVPPLPDWWHIHDLLGGLGDRSPTTLTVNVTGNTGFEAAWHYGSCEEYLERHVVTDPSHEFTVNSATLPRGITKLLASPSGSGAP